MIVADDVNRTLTLSVRDLVSCGEPRGHLTLDVVRANRSRLLAGQRVHLEYQAAREAEDPHFAREVTVKHSEAVLGWTVLLQGRVDGLVEGEGHWTVEEVKSTALDAGRLYGTGLLDWGDYVEQLEIYLWMVRRARPAHGVSGRLVLVSLVDGSRHVIGVALDEPRVGRLIRERLRELVAARERRIHWMQTRRRLSVSWPHATYREGQAELRAGVESALAEGRPVFVQAPTGLGKTASVLAGALAVALRTDRQIFWATTRTTQQPVVLATLERLAAAGTPLRAVTLNAREKVCLNEVDGAVQVNCRPEECRFAANYFEKVRDSGVVARLCGGRSGRAELKAAGEAEEVCPYQLARDVSSHVDVVIGDLNYVFDPQSRLREFFEQDAKNWVVVCDEAHQLVERARAYQSPVLPARMAREAAVFLEGLGEGFSAFAFLARQVEDAIIESGLQVVGPVRGSEGVAEIDAGIWRDLADRVDELGLDYALLKADLREPVGKDPWLTLARAVLRFSSVLAGLDEVHSRVLVDGRQELVRIVCLDPSHWIGPQIAKLGGLVAASATLRPVEFHLDLLGLRQQEVRVLEVASPFPPERLGVFIADGVSTAYKDRVREAARTARLLQGCIEAIPGNVAVFFPSFAMLELLAGRLDLEQHEIRAQPRGLSEVDRDAWVARLVEGGRPVVLCAVLGGIFAEGVDLPPGALSGVLVCGPAYPPVGLERDLLQAQYEEAYDAGFLYASLVPGMTKVVQAAGRLIRRPEDRGVVVLVGRRFRASAVRALLPVHWDVVTSDRPASDVEGFFAVPQD